MEPRPSFDREILIAIAVGVVSILGLGWIFFTNDRGQSTLPPTVEPTVIPLRSNSPGTGTRPPRPSATPILENPPLATETSPVAYPGPLAETLPSTSTLIAENRPAPSATPTPAQPLPVGKYDDTDPHINYDRWWTFRMNSGTKYAYKGTLHMSTGIGNEASFHFTGQRFILGYQRGKNFGIVTVLIDDQSYSFHEQAFGNVWPSPQLSPGTHSVRLIHESGETINLDYIEIIG